MRWALIWLRLTLTPTLTAVLVAMVAGGPTGPAPASPFSGATGIRAPRPCTDTTVTLPGAAGTDAYGVRLCMQGRQQPHGPEVRAGLAIWSHPSPTPAAPRSWRLGCCRCVGPQAPPPPPLRRTA